MKMVKPKKVWYKDSIKPNKAMIKQASVNNIRSNTQELQNMLVLDFSKDNKKLFNRFLMNHHKVKLLILQTHHSNVNLLMGSQVNSMSKQIKT